MNSFGTNKKSQKHKKEPSWVPKTKNMEPKRTQKAPQELTGCLLGASWMLPGVSWVPPGCFLVLPGASRVPPGCNFGETKKTRTVRAVRTARVLRRDLCCVSENEGFCFQTFWPNKSLFGVSRWGHCEITLFEIIRK